MHGRFACQRRGWPWSKSADRARQRRSENRTGPSAMRRAECRAVRFLSRAAAPAASVRTAASIAPEVRRHDLDQAAVIGGEAVGRGGIDGEHGDQRFADHERDADASRKRRTDVRPAFETRLVRIDDRRSARPSECHVHAAAAGHVRHGPDVDVLNSCPVASACIGQDAAATANPDSAADMLQRIVLPDYTSPSALRSPPSRGMPMHAVSCRRSTSVGSMPLRGQERTPLIGPELDHR